ncbi:glycine oxidase ThiO [Aquibacillus rhizosphaerae]|uniref:glycine oxidase n=1 Tax=Aquibacillus rhizosphaerae TaxID=3051431 RepID=A0ABT7L4U2_9BACI|nr:glycine oxidase ThiO [Aquibacillus sp. LR5S19]MDL4839620.1 glycine oxidase ThiO [Aquibacillus sp. LR5S19]
MKNTYDSIIIGGGVNGCSIAYQLAKRGHSVLIVEKDRLAEQSSGAAAGMLAAQAELDQDGPLFQLARKSRSMFHNLSEQLKNLSGVDIELINEGMLKVALTEEEECHYKKIIEFQQSIGEKVEWLSPTEVCKKETNISTEIRGAMYIPNDGQVSAKQLTLGFAKSAVSLGVDILEYTEVEDILQEGGKVTGIATPISNYYAENVIVTAGAWSKRILARTNLSIQAYPVKGECFSVLHHKPLLKSTLFSEGCYLVPKKGGRIIIGATSNPHTFDKKVTVGGINQLMSRAISLLPAIAKTEFETSWAGIRPQTKDGLPFLGKHPSLNGVFIATGHYRNGILLAPITGELIADLVEDKPINPLFENAFKLDREMILIGEGV